MSQANNKLWEVEINNQIYQADEDTLKYWLIEGRVKPTDKVRRQDQDWVEITKIVKLQPSNIKSEKSSTGLVELEKAQILTVIANNVKEDVKEGVKEDVKEKAEKDIEEEAVSRKVTILEPIFYHEENWEKYLKIACQHHPELPPEVLCPECGAAFCKHCAKASHVGGSYNKASECPLCGALCRSYLEIKEKLLALGEQKAEFGWADLKIALQFPKGLSLTPIIIFTVLMGLGGAGFTVLAAISILSSTVICAVKDASAGEHEAREMDYTSFLSTFTGPLLAGLGAILIITAPYLALVVGNLKVFALLKPIAFIWGMFYCPIAILVAGFTESFASVVKLPIGFQALKQMGKLSQRLLAYFLLLEIPLIILFFMLPEVPMIEKEGLKVPDVLSILLIIAFIGLTCGAAFFYLSVAMGALVGRAVFKSANNLGLITKATTKL